MPFEKRIAVFTAHYYPHVGGVERFTRELWRRLAARGWEVTVVTTNTEGVAERETLDGMAVVRLPAVKIVKGRLPVVLPGKKVIRALAEVGRWTPSVVVTNTRFFATSVLGVLCARRWGVPCLHVDHGSAHVQVGSRLGNVVSELIDHTVGRWVLRHATHCVGVSRCVADFLAHLGRPDAGVLYNGVDAKAFDGLRGAARARLAIPSSHKVVLYVGRLIEEKGVQVLIDAFDRLGRDSDTHLVIAGDGHMMPSVRQRAAGSGNIHALGNVGPAQVAELLAECDVFAHPSAYPEGLPTAVLEAGAAGAAVIATPMGGTEEIIASREMGLIVPPRDPAQLAQALRLLLDSAELRCSMGAALRQRVREVFDWDSISDAAEAELLNLCQNTRDEEPKRE